MKLKDELGLRKDFHSRTHEALLNVYYTASRIRKRATLFFSDYGITDVQFNLMAVVYHQGGKRGLTQVDLSQMMLVNRANITSLIDRMEKVNLVERTADPEDRRCHVIHLTSKGMKLVQKVNAKYIKEVDSIMGCLKNSELGKLVSMLERIRDNV